MTSEEIVSEEIVSEEVVSEEIPLEMTSEEIASEEVVSEQIPLEMTSEEIVSEEVVSEEIPLEMTSEEIVSEEVVSEEIPLEMTSEEIASEEVVSEEIPLEMTSEEIVSEEVVSQEIPLEMTSEEIVSEEVVSQEIPLEITSEEIASEEIISEEIPLEMTSEEIVSEEIISEEILLEIKSEEMASEEMISEQIPLEMASDEILSEEIPLEITSEEIASEKVVSEEIPLEMTSEEKASEKILSAEIPLEKTSEEIISEEIPLEITSEETASEEVVSEEIPFEMTSEEIASEKKLSDEIPLETTSEEIASEEIISKEIISKEIPLEMTSEEIASEEILPEDIPLEMTSEEIISEEIPLEMTSEEIISEEIPLEMTSEEIISEEIPLEMTSEEIISEEIPLEMTSEEKVSEEITTEEILCEEIPLETTSEEITSEEIPLEMTSEEISVQEMPLEVTSEEILCEEIPLEMTSEEIISEEKTTEEIVSEEIPLEMTSEEMGSVELSCEETVKEIPLEETSEELPLGINETNEQIVNTESVQKEFSLGSQEETLNENCALKQQDDSTIIEEKKQDKNETVVQDIPVYQRLPLETSIEEQPFAEHLENTNGIPAIQNMLEEQAMVVTPIADFEIKEISLPENKNEGSWSMEVIGVIPDKELEQSTTVDKTFVEVTQHPLPDSNNSTTEITYEPLLDKVTEPKAESDTKIENKQSKDAKRELETTKQAIDQRTFSNESTPTHESSQSCACSPRYEQTCKHQFMVEELKTKISRIEREKEYLQGKYDELRRGNSNQFFDHSECGCTPRSTVSECCHCECMSHTCGRRNTKRSSSESDYYKLKCDQIRKEKENLELAYEGERRQKEDMEREYEHERNEKHYIEKKYEMLLQTMGNFEDTIRDLRRENENLQLQLSEWSSTRTHSLNAVNSAVQFIESSDESNDELLEYRRSLDVLERENREFREILDTLNRKNERQENLKGIELGLVREKEFLDLKKDRSRLEDTIRDQKRTIMHQQERIEEIRNKSEEDVWSIKEDNKKNERKIKELQKDFDQQEREVDDLKRSHGEEIRVLEIKLQNESSNRSQFQSQASELQLKVQRLEDEEARLREQLNINTSSQPFVDETYGEDVSILRRKYEEEQKSKVKLANDIKYLLHDIMDLKDKNKRIEDDFIRERNEIKNMLEKQANEITHVYLTQIAKLQGALADEKRKREMFENGLNPAMYGSSMNVRMSHSAYPNQTGLNGMQTAQQYEAGNQGNDNNNIEISLKNEITKREALEVENKNLLYEMNKLLSGINGEECVGNYQGLEKEKVSTSSNSSTGLQRKNKELMQEIVELKENIEDMETLTKKNKQYKNKICDLQEELDHVTRKKDDLASAHRNLKRDVDHLSTTLDDLERKNRKYSDEVDRLMKKIQDLEDSFQCEKTKLVRNHENEMERTLEEADRRNEELQRKVQEQTRIIQHLEEVAGEAGYDVQNRKEKSESFSFKQIGHDSKSPTKLLSSKGNTDVYVSSLKEQVENLQRMLQISNKRHEDEIKRVEIQKKEMKEEFEKKRQSLSQYFNQEKVMLERRLQETDNNRISSINGLQNAANPYERVPNEISPAEAFITAQETNDLFESIPSVSSSPGFPTSLIGQRQSSMNSSYPRRSPDTTATNINPLNQQNVTNDMQATIAGGHANNQQPSNPIDVSGFYKDQPTSFGNGNVRADTYDNSQYSMNKYNPTLNQVSSNRQLNYNGQGSLEANSAQRLSSSGGDFERQIRDVQEKFNQDKNDILRKAADEKLRIQKNIGQQMGRQLDNMNHGYEEELNHLHNSEQRLQTTFQSPLLERKDDRQMGKLQQQQQKAQSEIQKLQKQLQKQRRDYEEQIRKLIQEKRAINNALQSMTKEISVLKCERKSIRCSSRSEIERLERAHDIEKSDIRESYEKSKREEISRIRAENEQRASKERKRLQQSMDDLRRKISDLEQNLRMAEVALQNEKQKFERERYEYQRTLSRNQEEIKVVFESEYKKKLASEKLKFEKTLRDLRMQISSLQEQRKQIQIKLANKESGMSNDRISRERIILQLEQDFLEKMEKEKRPLEEKINDLRDELSKAKREKNAVKTSMEKEKEELQEEVERVKGSMRDKLQKAKEEIDRRSDLMSRNNMMTSKIKNMTMVSADLESQHQAQSSLKHYQEQLNLLEQRNLTLHSKNERLEREVKVLNGRVESLENRNRELQITSSNTMSSMTYETPAPRHRGFRADYSSIGNTNVGHSLYSRPSNMQESPLMQGSDPYSSILDRVQRTMHTAGVVGVQDYFAGSRSLTGMPGNGMPGIGLQRRVINGGIVGGSGLAMSTDSQFGGMSSHGEFSSNTQMTTMASSENHLGMYNGSSVIPGKTVSSEGALNKSEWGGDIGVKSNNVEICTDANKDVQYGVTSSVEQIGDLNESTLSNNENSSSFIEKEISEDVQNVRSMNSE